MIKYDLSRRKSDNLLKYYDSIIIFFIFIFKEHRVGKLNITIKKLKNKTYNMV